MKRRPKAKSNVGRQRDWQGGEAGPTVASSASRFVEVTNCLHSLLMNEVPVPGVERPLLRIFFVVLPPAKIFECYRRALYLEFKV